jgi:hypothetical protein
MRLRWVPLRDAWANHAIEGHHPAMRARPQIASDLPRSFTTAGRACDRPHARRVWIPWQIGLFGRDHGLRTSKRLGSPEHTRQHQHWQGLLAWTAAADHIFGAPGCVSSQHAYVSPASSAQGIAKTADFGPTTVSASHENLAKPALKRGERIPRDGVSTLPDPRRPWAQADLARFGVRDQRRAKSASCRWISNKLTAFGSKSVS